MTTAADVNDSPATASSGSNEGAPLKKKTSKKFLLALVVLLLVVGGISYWLYSRNYESTDDAQVDGHFAQLSTRVTGTVTYVNPLVENDRFVKAGTLLLELDPRDYQAELQHAKANLAAKEAEAHVAATRIPITNASAYSGIHLARAAEQEARANVAAAQADLLSAQHRVQLDEAIASRAERDRVRYAALIEKHEISRSFYDARETDALGTAQTLASDRAAVAAAEQKIAQTNSIVIERQAQVESADTAPQQVSNVRASSTSAEAAIEQARADVTTAELNLSYTKIYAPVSGVVGQKTVELGHRVQPGQTLLSVVPTDDLWVTANFKETQMHHMRPGQKVTIHVDTFDRDYRGTIEDMAGAAGPLFSLFPPENASGNYVKIVQRFPLRIRLDDNQNAEQELRPGMSVEATVTVR